MHLTHHVFSKIGLVMLFCRSVLVRDGFLLSNSAFFSLSKYAGARACIGRKYVNFFPSNQSIYSFFFRRFAETEGTAVLVMLVSHYRITVKEEPQFVGETFEEKKSRILSSHLAVTVTCVLKNNLFSCPD